MNLIEKIIVPGVTLKGEIRKKKKNLEEAYELGRRLAQYKYLNMDQVINAALELFEKIKRQ